MSKKLVTIYTVSRKAKSAPARNAVGYGSVNFQFVATSEADAINQAVEACRYRDPWDNFWFSVESSRVEVIDA